ncbi:MAG: hypothetical protein WC140_02480 [Bacteroidales bacterium]
MRFNDIIENKELILNLKKMSDTNRVAHAIMFVENDGQGAIGMVLSLTQYIMCESHNEGDSCGKCPKCNRISKLIHPDVHFVFPVNSTSKSSSRKPISEDYLNIWRSVVLDNPYFTETKLNSELGIENKVGIINVAEADRLLQILSLHSYEGGKKVFIIYLPERMNTATSNKLLKMIEEPTPNTYFFFVSHSPENIIQTIISRCLLIRLDSIDTNALTEQLILKYDLSKEEAYSFAKISNGNYGQAISYIKDKNIRSPYLELIEKLLKESYKRNLFNLLQNNDAFVKLGRDKQKAFTQYFEEIIRKIMLCNQGLEKIAFCTEEELQLVKNYKNISLGFFEPIFKKLEDLRMSIESNVNAKVAFFNFMNLLFIDMRKFTKKK